MQFHAILVPFTPEIVFLELGFCGPRDIVDNLRDQARAAVLDEVDPVLVSHGREKREKKAVGISSLLSRNIFLVENVMQEGSWASVFDQWRAKKQTDKVQNTDRVPRRGDLVGEMRRLRVQGQFYGRAGLCFRLLDASTPPRTRKNYHETRRVKDHISPLRLS